jgi:TolB-like protein/DNA-binding winged helix-turn-helix (wHTH) protein
MPAPASRTERVQFGVFELDLRRAELRNHGVKVKLQEQPLRVLQVLLENPGQIVSRDELRQRIWPENTFVEFDQGLYSAMARLRDALRDSSESPRFIETVPRRGYRFIAPVLEIPLKHADNSSYIQSSPAKSLAIRRWIVSVIAGLVGGAALLALVISFDVLGAREWLRSRTTPIRSIAVLPLQNLSNDPEQQYFADGMTDELITNLAMLKDVRVISRTSVMQYKGTKKTLPEIGRELNVDAVVEGSVIRSGERVRITAQLLDAATDRHLWAASYDRDVRDAFQIQAEAARSITDSIRSQFSAQQKDKLAKARPVNPEAYDLYLQARSYSQQITHPDIKQCIDHLQLSIQKDPLFPEAYVALADCYSLASLAGIVSESDAMARERNAVTRALELDDTQAEAHALLCQLNILDWNWEAAERECQRALDLGPNVAAAHDNYSDLLLFIGKPEESVREMRRAADLDPLSLRRQAGIGWQLLYARRYEEAIQEFQQVLRRDPNYVVAHTGLGRAYRLQGAYDLAIPEMKWTFVLAGFSDTEAASLVDELHTAYRGSGARGFWKKLLEWDVKNIMPPEAGFKNRTPAYYLAVDYANIGDVDRAFSCLRQAYQQHEQELVALKKDPRLDPLRSDPRFDELVKQVGLPQ